MIIIQSKLIQLHGLCIEMFKFISLVGQMIKYLKQFYCD